MMSCSIQSMLGSIIFAAEIPPAGPLELIFTWVPVLIVLALIVLVYFAPTYLAYKKSKKQKTAITVLNVFLGWTFLGWVGALVWAFMED